MKRILFLMISIPLLFSQGKAQQYYGVDKVFTKNTSIGVQVGTALVLSDVDVDLRGSFELGLNLQKVISRPFDFRLQLHYGNAYGLNTQASTGILNNTSLNGVCFDCGPTEFSYVDSANLDKSIVYHNYRMRYFDGSFQLKVNLNRLAGQGGENWEVYVFGGAGSMLYSTHYDALDQNNDTYAYQDITETSPGEVRNILLDMLDGTYETYAQQDVVNKTGFGQYGLSGLFNSGLGFQIKLSEKLSVGLEGRLSFVTDDLLDGQQWENNNELTTDLDKPFSGTLNINYIFPVKE